MLYAIRIYDGNGMPKVYVIGKHGPLVFTRKADAKVEEACRCRNVD